MQYTSFLLSTLAFISLFKFSDAKRMSDDEARRKLYTLAELLDAEIAAREELSARPLRPQAEKSETLDKDVSIENLDGFEQFLNVPKTHHKLILPIDESLFPAQNAKRSSNLLRLANQAARGFGK